MSQGRLIENLVKATAIGELKTVLDENASLEFVKELLCNCKKVLCVQKMTTKNEKINYIKKHIKIFRNSSIDEIYGKLCAVIRQRKLNDVL